MVNEKSTKSDNGSSPPKNSKRVDPKSIEWLNPQPNSSDVSWLQDHEDDLTQLVFEMVDDLNDNERLSIKYDGYSSRWIAMFFGGSGDTRNSGCALSVRGATPYDATVLLAYFHLVRFSRDWRTSSSETSTRWG